MKTYFSIVVLLFVFLTSWASETQKRPKNDDFFNIELTLINGEKKTYLTTEFSCREKLKVYETIDSDPEKIDVEDISSAVIYRTGFENKKALLLVVACDFGLRKDKRFSLVKAVGKHAIYLETAASYTVDQEGDVILTVYSSMGPAIIPMEVLLEGETVTTVVGQRKMSGGFVVGLKNQFKRHAKKCFKRDPDIVKRIDEGELTLEDVAYIVEAYNPQD